MRIGFSSSSGLGSALIRYATHSKVSHAYIVFDVAGEELVLEASVRGVICDHYRNFRSNHQIVAEYELLLRPEQSNHILAYALNQLTLPYDFLGLLGFGWVICVRALGLHAHQPFKERKAYYCSALVISALQHANFPTSHALDRFLTSPEDLMEFLSSHLETKQLI
jgi:hypothetical protein